VQVSGVVNGALSTQVNPPGDEVTVYEVISAPPLLLGAVNVTTALVFPATALTEVTNVGFVAGITEFDGADGAVTPELFCATAVKV
jgi:hypothetical protein